MKQQRLIIYGAGELGGRAAHIWLAQGGTVIAYTHTDRRHAELTQAGVEPRLGSPANELRSSDYLLLALPGHARQRTAVEGLISEGSIRPQRAVMISSTGYYGQQATGIINENSPAGSEERAQQIALAEQVFLDWLVGNGVVIRAGGLYSETRGPRPAVQRKGQPRLGPPNKRLALVHYQDVALAVVGALSHPSPQPAYVAISPPCPIRQTFFDALCQRLNLPAPAYTDPLPIPPVTYDVSLLRHDLLPEPRYPDWRTALGKD